MDDNTLDELERQIHEAITQDGKRYRYRYRAVTADGHGVHSKDYVSLAACRKRVAIIKGTWPDAEVQRVRELMRGDEPWARQYELEHNGRWMPDSKVKAFREGASRGKEPPFRSYAHFALRRRERHA